MLYRVARQAYPETSGKTLLNTCTANVYEQQDSDDHLEDIVKDVPTPPGHNGFEPDLGKIDHNPEQQGNVGANEPPLLG